MAPMISDETPKKTPKTPLFRVSLLYTLRKNDVFGDHSNSDFGVSYKKLAFYDVNYM